MRKWVQKVGLNYSLHFVGEKSSRICGAASVRCYETAELKLFGEDVIDGLQDTEAKSFREKCKCLPGCTSIIYDGEIDRAKFDPVATAKSFKSSLGAG